MIITEIGGINLKFGGIITETGGINLKFGGIITETGGIDHPAARPHRKFLALLYEFVDFWLMFVRPRSHTPLSIAERLHRMSQKSFNQHYCLTKPIFKHDILA